MKIAQTFSARLQQPKSEGLAAIVNQKIAKEKQKLAQWANTQQEKSFENARSEIKFFVRGEFAIAKGDFLPTRSVSTFNDQGKRIIEFPSNAAQIIARTAKLKYLGRFIDRHI